MSVATFVPLAAAGVSTAGNIIGGMMSDSATAEANRVSRAQYKQQMQYQRKMDRKNIQLQREFAQQGIRWKVADAEAAGIHPLYALGAQTMSFNPVSAGGPGIPGAMPETGMANALAASGQDISRAIHATRTQTERDIAYEEALRAAQLRGAWLQNDLLASQIHRINQPTNPPMPLGQPIPEVAATERPEMQFMGWKWLSHPNTTTAQDWNQHYGDEFPGNLPGMAAKLYSDLWYNSIIGRWYYGQYPFNR